MDAPPLSPERSIELAALRRRAYGPDADIGLDPIALQRLSELEELARPPVESRGDPADPVDPAPASSAEDDALAPPARPARDAPGARIVEPAPAAGTEVASPVVPPDRPWWRRIPLWGATAVVGIVLGAAIGFTWPNGDGPPPDVTLGVDPNGGERGAGFTENLDYWGVNPGTVVPHEGYDVIQVWTALGIDESRCLLLSHDGSFLSATCTGAGLDPVLDFTIYDGLSLDLETPLPVGTVIRFVGHEGSVDVWVRPPGGQVPEAISSSADRPSAS
ncbi:hypothetical protein [Microbacterium sp. Root180]|uniref:hypothetical protein n=1 Tax=Microbacterium sp. Root180 TaxID=1736483 RepID=UPI0006F7819C|nr:hypothetical protein [Microbacterium sp. Root180]KRB38106.1 hypothetical protein ASD93_07330 [Microbacterium sp. Root180]